MQWWNWVILAFTTYSLSFILLGRLIKHLLGHDALEVFLKTYGLPFYIIGRAIERLISSLKGVRSSLRMRKHCRIWRKAFGGRPVFQGFDSNGDVQEQIDTVLLYCARNLGLSLTEQYTSRYHRELHRSWRNLRLKARADNEAEQARKRFRETEEVARFFGYKVEEDWSSYLDRTKAPTA